MSKNAPVEGKVWASTVGGGAGATVSSFVLWILGVLVWGAPSNASSATDAVAAVPFPVIGVVGLVITVGGVFIGGYLAKHTPRPAVTEELEFIEEMENAVPTVDAEPIDEPIEELGAEETIPEYEDPHAKKDDDSGRFYTNPPAGV